MKDGIERKIGELDAEYFRAVEENTHVDFRELLWKAATAGRDSMIDEALRLLVEEIVTAHGEGTPTARLTSLHVRLSGIRAGV